MRAGCLQLSEAILRQIFGLGNNVVIRSIEFDFTSHAWKVWLLALDTGVADFQILEGWVHLPLVVEGGETPLVTVDNPLYEPPIHPTPNPLTEH